MPIWHLKGMKLSQYLSENNLSTTEFAEQVGCDRSAVVKIKNGNRRPRKDLAERIFKATNGAVTPLDYFDFGHGDAA